MAVVTPGQGSHYEPDPKGGGMIAVPNPAPQLSQSQQAAATQAYEQGGIAGLASWGRSITTDSGGNFVSNPFAYKVNTPAEQQPAPPAVPISQETAYIATQRAGTNNPMTEAEMMQRTNQEIGGNSQLAAQAFQYNIQANAYNKTVDNQENMVESQTAFGASAPSKTKMIYNPKTKSFETVKTYESKGGYTQQFSTYTEPSPFDIRSQKVPNPALPNIGGGIFKTPKFEEIRVELPQVQREFSREFFPSAMSARAIKLPPLVELVGGSGVKMVSDWGSSLVVSGQRAYNLLSEGKYVDSFGALTGAGVSALAMALPIGMAEKEAATSSALQSAKAFTRTSTIKVGEEFQTVGTSTVNIGDKVIDYTVGAKSKVINEPINYGYVETTTANYPKVSIVMEDLVQKQIPKGTVMSEATAFREGKVQATVLSSAEPSLKAPSGFAVKMGDAAIYSPAESTARYSAASLSKDDLSFMKSNVLSTNKPYLITKQSDISAIMEQAPEGISAATSKSISNRGVDLGVSIDKYLGELKDKVRFPEFMKRNVKTRDVITELGDQYRIKFNAEDLNMNIRDSFPDVSMPSRNVVNNMGELNLPPLSKDVGAVANKAAEAAALKAAKVNFERINYVRAPKLVVNIAPKMAAVPMVSKTPFERAAEANAKNFDKNRFTGLDTGSSSRMSQLSNSKFDTGLSRKIANVNVMQSGQSLEKALKSNIDTALKNDVARMNDIVSGQLTGQLQGQMQGQKQAQSTKQVEEQITRQFTTNINPPQFRPPAMAGFGFDEKHSKNPFGNVAKSFRYREKITRLPTARELIGGVVIRGKKLPRSIGTVKYTKAVRI